PKITIYQNLTCWVVTYAHHKKLKNKTIKFELSLEAYTTKQLVEDVFPLLNCFHISISNTYPISKPFPDYSFIHMFCIFAFTMMISYGKVLLPKDS
ncbi:MAG: hypothetical protein O2809_02955, partial [Proteobacteria bacterium]|nr:hypothetical protein [Pseudomonadota bacterium]